MLLYLVLLFAESSLRYWAYMRSNVSRIYYLFDTFFLIQLYYLEHTFFSYFLFVVLFFIIDAVFCVVVAVFVFVFVFISERAPSASAEPFR